MRCAGSASVRPAPVGPAARRDGNDGNDADRGSVTPLVIGMVLCLLLLGAGVIAAGSVVLARRNLQSACDGAADAVSGSATPDQMANGAAALFERQLADYLAIRMPEAVASTSMTATNISVQCETDASVAFGALFGSPKVHVEVNAVTELNRG